MLVLVTLVIVAAVPPMVTLVAPVKFVPVITTIEPPPSGPLEGEMPVTVGAAVYLYAAGRPAAAVGMLVAAVVIGVSDNLVRPWVQSARTKMHPLITLLAIFGGIHVFTDSGDVPDDWALRLVVLPPDAAFSKSGQSLAIERATEILKKRGDQPRFKQNRLIFLAADYDSVSRLKDHVRSYLAWRSIVADYKAFAEQIGLTDVRFIPLSALVGDMIVDRGERLDWYDGPTLIDILEAALEAAAMTTAA